MLNSFQQQALLRMHQERLTQGARSPSSKFDFTKLGESIEQAECQVTPGTALDPAKLPMKPW